jgi:hypothetical protein
MRAPCAHLRLTASRRRLRPWATVRRSNATQTRARRGSPTPPKPPTEGLPRYWRPSVGQVARSETGHSAAGSCDIGDRRGSPTPPKPPTEGLPRYWRPSVGQVARSETGHSAAGSCSARVSDPAETADRRSPAILESAAGSSVRPRRNRRPAIFGRPSGSVGDRPQRCGFVLGEGLRPRRIRRPKVSRDIGDLRSARWLGSGDRPQRCGFVLGEGLRPRRNRRPKVSRDIGDLRSAKWLGRRPATALRVRARRGSPTPPKPPTEGLPRYWRPSVGQVARSETGHSAAGK